MRVAGGGYEQFLEVELLFFTQNKSLRKLEKNRDMMFKKESNMV